MWCPHDRASWKRSPARSSTATDFCGSRPAQRVDYVASPDGRIGGKGQHVHFLRGRWHGVESSNDSRGFFSSAGLSRKCCNRATAVVVPQPVCDYETWGPRLRSQFEDWSQILSQFGLGAAAIKPPTKLE